MPIYLVTTGQNGKRYPEGIIYPKVYYFQILPNSLVNHCNKEYTLTRICVLVEFSNKIEKDEFVKNASELNGGDYLIFYKPKSFVDLVHRFYNERLFYYNNLQLEPNTELITSYCDHFLKNDNEFLSRNFPNETITDNTVNKIIKLCEKSFDYLWNIYEGLHGQEEIDSEPKGIPIENLTNDVIWNWDEETDGIWRDATDFG